MVKPITIHPATDAESFLLMLIGEALKSRKFFNTLMELGLDNSYYQPNLDDAIFSCLGIVDERNETFEFYSRVMDEASTALSLTGRIGLRMGDASLPLSMTGSVEVEAREVLDKLRGLASSCRPQASS